MKIKFSLLTVTMFSFLLIESCNQTTAIPNPTETSTATIAIQTETSVPPNGTPIPVPTVDAALEPVHGVLELADGYHPNPLIKPLLYGGDIDLAAEFEDLPCAGFVESAPDMAIDWSGGGFLRIFFLPD